MERLSSFNQAVSSQYHQ